MKIALALMLAATLAQGVVIRNRLDPDNPAPPASLTTCNGLTPTIWAATSAQGAADGSSEANAVAFTTAITTATAGDVVCLSPGTYIGAYNAGANSTPIFRLTNDGTSGSPIVLTCKYRAVDLLADEVSEGDIASDARRCEFQYTGGTVGTATSQPLLGGTESDSYIRIYGVYIQANTSVAPCRPSHGCIKIVGTGMQFEWIVIDQGDATTALDDDNFTPFFSLDGDDLVLRNNVVRGGDNGTLQHANLAVLTMYGSHNFLVEHNSLLGVTSGFFVKGSNASSGHVNYGIIRYNFIRSGGAGILSTADIEPEGVEIYQNIVVGNNCTGVTGIEFNASTGALTNPLHVYNNTLYCFATRGGAASAFYVSEAIGTGLLRFYNNIAVYPASTATPMIEADGIDLTTTDILDFNLYFEDGGTATWRGQAALYSSLANWRTYTGDEANSTVADPLFVNAGSGNFHLDTGSPALTLGRVGGTSGGATIPAGAYITGSETIGVQ